MAEEIEQHDPNVAPPGEVIHLPGPSYLPVIVALGVSVALVGVVINWYTFGLGVLITAVAVGRWISQARAEMAELPLEHH